MEQPSDDTPSVSRSLDSSLREGAGDGLHHSPGCSLISGVTGDFHRPYETLNVSHFPIHRGTLPQSRPLGVTAPSEREPGMGWCHSTGYSLKSGVTGDFHRPYEGRVLFTRLPGKLEIYSTAARNAVGWDWSQVWIWVTGVGAVRMPGPQVSSTGPSQSPRT